MKDEFKARIVKALGLDDARVRSVTVKFSDGDIPLVTIEMYPSLEESKYEWIDHIYKLKLCPREEGDDSGWAPL